MRARPSRRTSAATLIELLTVMSVLAVLAAIAIGTLVGLQQRGALARSRSELAALAAALEEFKRHYGDYPQLGEFAHAALVPASATAGPGTATAEARLFNCLTGVFGPRAFATTDRISGPNFLEGSRFLETSSGLLNGAVTATFLVPAANADRPPSRTEQNVSLVDPWGRRYLYYYKDRRNPAAWQAPGYLLFSVGRDGAHTPPPVNGVMTTTQLNAANNADNLYANR
jgi:type II secretory pathway pseudopilin PulG